MPEVPETYVHRIGRTGRAGLGGIAISFCDYEEKPLLRDIQKLIVKTIPEVTDHPYPLMDTTIKPKEKSGRRPGGSRNMDSRPSSSKKKKPEKVGKIRREKRGNEPKKNTKKKTTTKNTR